MTQCLNEPVEKTVGATIPPGRNPQYSKSNSNAGLLHFKEFQSYSKWFNKNTSPDAKKIMVPTTLTLSGEAKLVLKPTIRRKKPIEVLLSM